MERESWNNEEIRKIPKSYIPLMVDLVKRTELARQYGVNAIPLLLIIDASGEFVFSQVGYMSKDQLSVVLKKYALNTRFMRAENLNYFRHHDYATGIRLAQKYIDFSQYLQKDIQQEFLSLASKYL